MFKPRDYQLEAFSSFKNNNCNGIFEMATGTGKTFTSLLCASESFISEKRMFLVILVPFNHLVPQWIENAKVMGFNDFLVCNNSKMSWLYNMESKIRDFNSRISDLECVITSYKTASSDTFNSLIARIQGHSFLISDECHYFGIRKLRNNSFSTFKCKLGLSATPDRWWDPQGTQFIRNFFGDTIYEYSMEMAIDKRVLTNYNYYPIKATLDYEECKKYKLLTEKICKLSFEYDKNKEIIEKLSRQRSAIISKAKNKKEILISLLKEKNIQEIKNTLVYCAPGEIDEITRLIANLGIRVHRFDSKIDMGKRAEVLRRFEQGEIQILVAIKCLDEGVDVPSTETAYFLSSTTNPREFIQRRGRILRRFDQKQLATIYDFIIVQNETDDRTFESIIRKEMPRFAEFSRYALNKYSARDCLYEILNKRGLCHLMDKLPWEVYKENLLMKGQL